MKLNNFLRKLIRIFIREDSQPDTVNDVRQRIGELEQQNQHLEADNQRLHKVLDASTRRLSATQYAGRKERKPE